MFKILISSVLAVTTIAQSNYQSKVKKINAELSKKGPNGAPLTHECSSCLISLCGETLQLPDTMDCNDLNNDILSMRNGIFKPSDKCKEKGGEYVCDVFVKPYSKLFKKVCNHETIVDSDIEKASEESFCEANENCKDLSRCIYYNIDCEYDANIIPQLEVPNSHDEGECPHEDIDEKVKTFFEDYWKTMVIAGVICVLFSSVIIIIIVCRKPRQVIVRDNNVV